MVRDGEVIATGSNRTNELRNGTRHAEFEAIDAILARPEVRGDPSAAGFDRCSLYVTCEPCIMCAGALSLLGFHSVVFGCGNDKFGGNGSILSVHEFGCSPCGEQGGVEGDESSGQGGAEPRSTGDTSISEDNSTQDTSSHNHQYPSYGGLFAADAIQLLQDFYIRGNPKAPKPHRALASEAIARKKAEHELR